MANRIIRIEISQEGWDESICPDAYRGCIGAKDSDVFRVICSGEYCLCAYLGFGRIAKRKLIETNN